MKIRPRRYSTLILASEVVVVMFQRQGVTRSKDRGGTHTAAELK
jgi:hypothetical protein